MEEKEVVFFWDSLAQIGQIYGEEGAAIFSLSSSPMIRIGDDLFLGEEYISLSEEKEVIFSSVIYDKLSTFFKKAREQTSYHISRIILDPGHGGKDTGAVGTFPGKVRVVEKDVVLNVGLALAEVLEKRYPNIEILLTRDDDHYLSLKERVNLANVETIDPYAISLFISLHANASLNTRAKGFEIWYLPLDHTRNVVLPNQYTQQPSSVKRVLNTLWQAEFLNESKHLAQFLLNGLDSRIGFKSPNRGLKEEDWFVVRKARMASVLVEIGFVTHAKEGHQLMDDMYLEDIVKGLYDGIEEFIYGVQFP